MNFFIPYLFDVDVRNHAWNGNFFQSFSGLFTHAPRNDPIHTSGTDKELYAAIKNHIQPCQIVIIMAGVYASYSKWIDKEIRIAKKEFWTVKPILAVKPWGNTNVSAVVKDAADELVNWNTDSIVDAIRRLAL